MSRTRPQRNSRPSSRASNSEEFQKTVPTLAAQVGVPLREVAPETPSAIAPPPRTSRLAKQRKAYAQSRDNATQPDPLPEGESDGDESLFDQLYDNLDDPEERREWLLQALELREPRKNYRVLDLDVEELETLYWDKPSATIDNTPRLDVGIYLGAAKVLERGKASKRPKATQDVSTLSKTQTSSSASHQTSTRPSLTPPTGSPQKLVSVSSTSRPAVKVSKARIAELRQADANAHLHTTSKRKAPETGSSERQAAASPQSGAAKRHRQSEVRPQAPRPQAPRPAAPPQAGSVDLDSESRLSSPPVADQHSPPPESLADEPQPRTSKQTRSTKRSEAQLSSFGPAAPIVSLALELMFIEMAVMQPFPEVVEDDEELDDSDGGIVQTRLRLFDRWAVEFYEKAHRLVRRGKSAIPQEDRHTRYMKYQLSQLRHRFRKAAWGKIPLVYSLERGDPRSVTRAADLLTDDRFLSPNFENDGYQFTIDIVKETIREALFDGPKDLGSKYSDCFYPMMPRATIALAASVIRHGIKTYNTLTVTKKTSSLEAGEDQAQFQRFMDMMASMPNKNLANQLKNTQRGILKSCMLSGTSSAELPETVIEVQERDSEEDLELEQELTELVRKRNAGKQRRMPSMKNTKGKQRESNPAPGPSGSRRTN